MRPVLSEAALTRLLVLAALLPGAAAMAAPAATGPLRVNPQNPRYFTDGSGKAVYLSGLQFWDALREDGTPQPEGMEFDGFLKLVDRYGMNFIRLWRWNELAKFRYTRDGAAIYSSPSPWKRTGPGKALDGKPKFDLSQFDPAYFDRMRSRVKAAGERGIYVSIMLFEGHSLQFSDAPWKCDGHPMHRDNNVNGIDADPDRDGSCIEIHTLGIPDVTRVQEAYVHKVIDTVGDLDNVLYEISNETGSYSTEWQYHFIRFIKACEASRPKQHPVGMSFQYKGGRNSVLFASPADWIAPNRQGGYSTDPPAATGEKVILADADHISAPTPGDGVWVWKCFLRGLNPVNYMEPRHLRDTSPKLESARSAMGQTVRLSRRVNLAAMTPRPDLASSRYCLADPGKEYLVYLPEGGEATVDLAASSGPLAVEWIDPRTGATARGDDVPGGGTTRRFKSPPGGDAVLYLRRRAEATPGRGAAGTSR